MTNITTFIKACLITDLLEMNFLNEPFILNKTQQDTVPVSFMTNELFQTDLFAIVTQKNDENDFISHSYHTVIK